MIFDEGADYWYTRYYNRPDEIKFFVDNQSELGEVLEVKLGESQAALEQKYNGKFIHKVNGNKLEENWNNKTIKYDDNLKYLKLSDFKLNENDYIDHVRVVINPCFDNTESTNTKVFIIPRCQKPLSIDDSLAFYKGAEEITRNIIEDIYDNYMNVINDFYYQKNNKKLQYGDSFYELCGKVSGSKGENIEKLVKTSSSILSVLNDNQAINNYFTSLINGKHTRNWKPRDFKWKKVECYDTKENISSIALIGFRGDKYSGLFIGTSFGDPHVALRPTMLKAISRT